MTAERFGNITTREEYIAASGEPDFIDLHSSLGSLTCKHRLYNFEKCSKCNVILYDKPTDLLRDVTFEDLMIASPRRVPIPSDLEAMVQRMREENIEIAKDAETKFKKQIDYVHAQQEQDRINAPMTPGKDRGKNAAIVFEENIIADRATLFPKLHVSQIPTENILLTRGLTVEVTEALGANIIDLTSEASVSTSTITVYLPPCMREPGTTICVQIDGTVVVEYMVEAILRRHTELASDKWCLRWIDDDEDAPDFDLPPIDGDQFVLRLNANELCMCPDSS